MHRVGAGWLYTFFMLFSSFYPCTITVIFFYYHMSFFFQLHLSLTLAFSHIFFNFTKFNNNNKKKLCAWGSRFTIITVVSMCCYTFITYLFTVFTTYAQHLPPFLPPPHFTAIDNFQLPFLLFSILSQLPVPIPYDSECLSIVFFPHCGFCFPFFDIYFTMWYSDIYTWCVHT